MTLTGAKELPHTRKRGGPRVTRRCAECGKRWMARPCSQAHAAEYAALMALRPLTQAERFDSHVDKNGPIVRPELGPCWVWTSAKSRFGHGRFRLGGRGSKQIGAHRWAWEQAHGPTMLQVCHHCDNPSCVRTEHLFEGTQLDNMRDMAAKGRRAPGFIKRGDKWKTA